MSPVCPLCASTQIEPYANVHGRSYFTCDVCGLIHMDPAQRPAPDEESARYATHNNDPADPGYRAFLSRLSVPLAAHLSPGAHGLDYGSGPGPTLSVMMRELGFEMTIYDPFFAPDPDALTYTYDFITCTETAEHFFNPGAEFERLDGLLRPGGWLGLMTGVWDRTSGFETWWYTRDLTHVCFYRPETLRWIAQHHDWQLERPERDVGLFFKGDIVRT